MAATSKKVKSRLDFGAALNEALFADNEVNNDINNEDEITGDKNDITIRDEDDLDTSNNDDENEQATANHPDSIDDVATRNDNNSSDHTTDNTGVLTTHAPLINSRKDVTYEDIEEDEDADMFLAIAKGNRGVQRSVYFESDVYQYLQDKSERYDVKFSNVVNLLIKEVIYKNKNQKTKRP